MNTTPQPNTAAAADHREAAAALDGTARQPWSWLAVGGLLLEVVALGALLIDGRQLTWIAWVPGWAGAVLAVIQVRLGRRPRVLAGATAVLFVFGTVLGIIAAVR